jgi:uncharacterized membrane protein AbrB (regulator of aidB expression)
MGAQNNADTYGMNTPLRSILKARRVAAVALAVAIVPVVASPASAASHGRSDRGRPATQAAVTAAAPAAAAPAAAATPAATPAPCVTSVISIGGYVFYNLTYAEAVDAWYAAVAAAPAGYTPPPVYSVSVNTTVSGTVEDGNGNG